MSISKYYNNILPIPPYQLLQRKHSHSTTHTSHTPLKYKKSQQLKDPPHSTINNSFEFNPIDIPYKTSKRIHSHIYYYSIPNQNLRYMFQLRAFATYQQQKIQLFNFVCNSSSLHILHYRECIRLDNYYQTCQYIHETNNIREMH